VDIAHSVAGDLIRVGLQFGDDDELEHTPALAQSLRGAMLIDLTIAGRLTLGPDGSEMDCSPTGWALADEVMSDINDHPTAPMERLLQHGHPHLSRFIDDLIDRQLWRITRHGIGAGHTKYEDVDGATYKSLQHRLSEIASRREPGVDSRTSVLALLAAVSGLTDVRASDVVPEEFFQSCGALESIVRDVATFVQDALSIDIASGRIDRIGMGHGGGR
jgi:hypothetical protein